MFPKPKRQKNRAYLDWVARQPCCGCGSKGVYHEAVGEYLNTPSHVKSRGAGGGDELNTVSHCFSCHQKLGRWGAMLFWQVTGVNLHRVARETYEKWKHEIGSSTTLSSQ